MSVLVANNDNFEELVLKSKRKVLVDFNADWCGPCQMLKPIIEEVADENSDVSVLSINIDDNDVLAEDYNIQSIPCLVVFKDGKEIKRSVGLISKEEIEGLLNE
ncbi:MAG: thioredoxin [Bacilli bacterium]|nr:thioredoxin [Bacilli bacterium]